MSLTRRELDIVYHNLKSQYRRKERDKDIRYGIDELYRALNLKKVINCLLYNKYLDTY